jgi:hypothetical protein
MNIGRFYFPILVPLMLFFFASCNENKNSLISIADKSVEEDSVEITDVSKSVAGKNVITAQENEGGLQQAGSFPRLPKYKYGDIYRRLSGPSPHHFAPKEGKELYYGVYNNVPSVFSDAKNKYGFTGVITRIGSIGNALTYGYPDGTKIYMLVGVGSQISDIDQAMDSGIDQFLYDEIGHAGILFPTFVAGPYLEIRARSGKLFADDYCTGFPKLGSGYYDALISNLHSMSLAGIGCDKYWDSGDIYGKDPREHWEYLKNGAKESFNFSWINTNDINKPHWIELLDWASTNGLKIFVYMGNGIEFYNMTDFCHAAFQAGWLREYDQKILSTYKCIAPEGTNDVPTGTPTGWRLLSAVPQTPYEIFR